MSPWRRLRILAVLLVGLLGTGTARAQDLAELTGRTVAAVSLQAVRGGLPAEDLQPLLRSVQGALLDPASVSLDVVTLMRVGDFSAVEAHVTEWVAVGADGTLQPAVQLTYRVQPAPRIAQVVLEGVGPARTRRILEALALTEGDPIHDPSALRAPTARIQDAYAALGYPQAAVHLALTTDDAVHHTLTVSVAEGPPRRARAVRFLGDPTVPASVLRRWAARAGVREGQPVGDPAIAEATARITTELRRVRPVLLRRPRGWVDATVGPGVTRHDDGDVTVTFRITPGTPLRLDVSGLGWRPRATFARVAGVAGRWRLSPSALSLAEERLRDWLATRGHLDPRLDVRLDDRSSPRRLIVDVDRGDRYRLGRIRVEGDTDVPAADIRAVLRAADDALRRGWYSPAGLRAGLQAVRDLYNAQGHPDATVELVQDTAEAAAGDRRVVQPVLRIDEGREVQLASLDWRLDAPGPDAPPLEAARARAADLVGRPHSPGRLEDLADAVRAEARAGGWLDADVRVETRPSRRPGDTAVHATLVVDTGPRVLLRAVVIRGARLTRRRLVDAEHGLVRGQPLTTGAIDRARQQLYRLGVFRSVATEVLGQGPLRDLVITVSESSTWAVEVGGGVHSDQGVRLFTRARRTNLWGMAHGLELRGLVGLDWLPSAEVGTAALDEDPTEDVAPPTSTTRGGLRLEPEWRVAASYRAPRFPVRRTELSFDVLLRERLQERTWSLARYGIGATLQARLGRTTLSTSLRWELRRLVDVDAGALIPDEAWALLDGGAWATDPSEDRGPSPWRPHQELALQVVHDRRDDPALPTRGLLASADITFAPGLDLGLMDTTHAAFLKADGALSGWIPLGGPILRITGQGGYARMLGGGRARQSRVLPLEERFRLGGTGSLRGFPRDAVGPHNALPLDVTVPGAVPADQAPDAVRWVPTGGDAYAKGVVELLLPLPLFGLTTWDGYALAVFADVGQVWMVDRAAEVDSAAPLARAAFAPPVRASVGLGPRVATPIGPVQVDLAFNLGVLAARGPLHAFLRDQRREPPLRLHVTLGNVW